MQVQSCQLSLNNLQLRGLFLAQHGLEFWIDFPKETQEEHHTLFGLLSMEKPKNRQLFFPNNTDKIPVYNWDINS